MASTQNVSRPKRPLRPDHQARLTKPFRSPLKSSASRTETVQHPTAQDPSKASLNSSSAVIEAHSTTVTAADGVTHDAGALYKQYKQLSTQLTQMRLSLDTAQQAVNILQNGQATSIQALIAKWKGVVRDAAEELFDDAKERVDRQGGLTRLHRHHFDDFSVEERGLSAEQKDILRKQQGEAHAEALKYGLLDSIEASDDQPEDQSFTMATMLRQMDVDPALVGYDEKELRWIT
ncbi:uncharacterized protein HMPREF1541_02047 [Cyphellophora europaea CBS 101466]|uniref:Swi5-dependent recombination DNA repair protein 1 n=1 Tax=Cyphellophora europaea (strain CBS 101466) TaxID=1220924 RepID=W2S4M7_CYPE1|nr:uncharacterized protein HMPREF1541_02047 [Cyphellophora europaea CBS 101466]ETN42889.1 hypothetical protein HMPREF1541_02047 [Cyphellophora europaea CBS 101466]